MDWYPEFSRNGSAAAGSANLTLKKTMNQSSRLYLQSSNVCTEDHAGGQDMFGHSVLCTGVVVTDE